MSCCHIVMRWIVLVLLFAGFVLSLVGTLPLPMFTNTLSGLGQSGKVEATLWGIRTGEVTVDSGSPTNEDGAIISGTVPKSDMVRVNHARCMEYRSYFRAIEAFSIVSTIVGFYAFLVMCLMCCCKLKVKLCVMLFAIFAAIFQLITVALGGAALKKTFCGKADEEENNNDASDAVAALNDYPAITFKGFKVAAGFIIQIIALIVYVVCIVLTPFTADLWCGKY